MDPLTLNKLTNKEYDRRKLGALDVERYGQIDYRYLGAQVKAIQTHQGCSCIWKLWSKSQEHRYAARRAYEQQLTGHACSKRRYHGSGSSCVRPGGLNQTSTSLIPCVTIQYSTGASEYGTVP